MLAFLSLSPDTSALRALHSWLDNWRGVGLVIDGMRCQGYDASLRTAGVDDGKWVAMFPRPSDDERTRIRGGGDAVGDGAAGGVAGDSTKGCSMRGGQIPLTADIFM